jgi:hypothetical protein
MSGLANHWNFLLLGGLSMKLFSFFVFFFFLAELGFELRALYLLGKGSTS